MRVRSLALLMCAGLVTCESTPQRGVEPGGTLNFGLLDGGSLDQLRVSRETRVIPKRVDTALPYYGFEYSSFNGWPFSLQTTLFPPEKPKHIKRISTWGTYDWTKGIKGQAQTFYGYALVGYQLNDDDALGHYKLVVSINGIDTFTIEYEIIAGNGH